jgi:hypothetical protein
VRRLPLLRIGSRVRGLIGSKGAESRPYGTGVEFGHFRSPSESDELVMECGSLLPLFFREACFAAIPSLRDGHRRYATNNDSAIAA